MPLISTLGMPEVTTMTDVSVEDHFEWLRILEECWIGEEQGNQISYTIKFNAEELTPEQFREIWLKNIGTVRCVSFLPHKPAELMKYEYLPETEISAEHLIEIAAGITSEDEVIDMDALRCLAGACPI